MSVDVHLKARAAGSASEAPVGSADVVTNEHWTDGEG